MSAQPSNPLHKIRQRIVLGVGMIFVIYIGLLLLLENQGQLSANDGLTEHLAQFPLAWLPVIAGLQLLAMGFRFVEWQYYLGVVGARDKLSLGDSAAIFVTGQAFVVSPGKAAELLKAAFVKAKTGVPMARTAPVVLAERIVDGIAVIVLLTVTLLIGGDALELGAYDVLSRTIIFGSALAIVVGLIVIQIQPLARFVLDQIVARLPLLRRLHQPLSDFYASSREVFKLRHVIPMTLVGCGVYGTTTLAFVVILLGFGLSFSLTLVFQASFILGIATAVGALSATPNGAGVTEVSTVGMLSVLVAPTVPFLTPALIAAIALMQSFFQKWFRVVVGVLVAVIFRKRLFADDFAAALLEAPPKAASLRATS